MRPMRLKEIEDIAKTIFDDKDLQVVLADKKIYLSQEITLHLYLDGKTAKANAPEIRHPMFYRKTYTHSEAPETYLYVKMHSKYGSVLCSQLQEFFTKAEKHLKENGI